MNSQFNDVAGAGGLNSDALRQVFRHLDAPALGNAALASSWFRGIVEVIVADKAGVNTALSLTAPPAHCRDWNCGTQCSLVSAWTLLPSGDPRHLQLRRAGV